MADPKSILEFPDVSNKLQAPTKKSLFERQKAEAEAKRLREEAETKAVYEDFIKSFDDEDEKPVPGAGAGGYGSGFGGRGGDNGFGSGGPPRRHFGGGAPSGPAAGRGFQQPWNGGRGSGPGSLGPPPPSLARKRGFEEARGWKDDRDRGLLAFEDFEDTKRRGKFGLEEEEDTNRKEDRAAAKPTLRLSSLPPGTSPAVIKALIPSNLSVDAVRILPPAGPGSGSERKSVSAIVTLASETAANDIDSTVNILQNKYLGYGYYLSLHRHLSSAAISSAPLPGLSNSTAAHPFGAKPVALPQAGRGQIGSNRNFAPPTSYNSVPGPRNTGPLLHVPVTAPSDIKTVKLIHKTIEALLTHGPEFEALLMSRPSVQREERWAWIWDARSVGGIWYRWRLWEILTGAEKKGGPAATKGKYLPLFEGSSAWKTPEQRLVFEYTTKLDQFVSDDDYNSSDDEDSGDESRKYHGGAPPTDTVDEGRAYLNPLEKAKLTHLLARLPVSTGKLRKGDVARVTAFAIEHAGRGADEIVSMVVQNISHPFAFTLANPQYKKASAEVKEGQEDGKEDTSSAQLIALYILSDILSSSSTSGVRHAWRYRGLFEAELKARKTFEDLARLEKKFGWGKLRAEKWKRSVGGLLQLWEGWCVFPQKAHDEFVEGFNNPPLTKEELKEKEAEEEERARGRWKAVEKEGKEAKESSMLVEDDVDGEPMEDVDGEPMDDENIDGDPMDEDIDGVPMDDEDIDGVPMDDEDVDGIPMEDEALPHPQTEAEQPIVPPPPSAAVLSLKERVAAATAKAQLKAEAPERKRPRAVDMFADSDDED